MKNTKQNLLAGTVTALAILAGQAFAQSQMSGPNGIAASPRLRAMLNERPAPASFVVSTRQAPSSWSSSQDTLAASPRLRSMLPASQNSTIAPSPVVVVQSPSRVSDNLAASPRLRSQLEERSMQFQVAPLK